jgi:multiple sugar transport system permease protein
MNGPTPRAASRRRWKLPIRPRTIVIHVVAWSIGLAWLLPFIGVAMVSLRPLSETSLGWWNLSPFHLTLDNFVAAWNNPGCPLSLGLRDSFFARFHTRTRDYIFLAVVLFMAVPQMMVAVPVYNLMIRLGLISNLLSLILIHSAWGVPWIILFMRNFFRTLPAEVEEAARVDGASDFKIFYKIVLPMALPAMAAVIVFQFMWVWNDFFFAQILIQKPDWFLSTQCVPRLVGQLIRPYDLMSAGAILTMIVPIGLYLVLQRFYIRGLIGWTIKG